MQIIPAIDLKDNKCVRLKKGKDETSFVFNDDPKKQALYFEEIGCKKIHIVDLDAAFGRPEVNIPSIKEIRNSVSIPIQLGGGIRSEIQAAQYFNLGINNIIIGSMSVN
ncbi:HisA/HisF-related TIM barrel protein, partial [Pelagibacteraceae bacterium]|nr:HisA/HisF-related TIM barrel protein [Pelagibacteraceae bacterium]